VVSSGEHLLTLTWEKNYASKKNLNEKSCEEVNEEERQSNLPPASN